MIRRARDVLDTGVWDPAVAIPTLVGSLLSFVASSIVITLWCVFGSERRSFRYALILNLTVAGKSPGHVCTLRSRIVHGVELT